MQVSRSGIELVKRHEGLRLAAYKCPAGVWTIGYGHTKGVQEGDQTTKEQADKYLVEDLYEAERGVNELKLDLAQCQFDALVSFVFNLGIANLLKSTLLKYIRSDSLDLSVFGEFIKWNKGGGKVLDGLVSRRIDEALLYFRDSKVVSRFVPNII
jgi:lysozyme